MKRVAAPETSGEGPQTAAFGWGAWGGAVLAVALAAAALVQLSHASSDVLDRVQGLPPIVWATFILLCLVQPAADLLIFRRLWRLSLSAFAVMLRKVVINDVLFGYSGELYLYVWARRQAGLSQAPFGAIKDVNILSALTGNILTLVMLALSAAVAHRVSLARDLGPVLWPCLGVVALSFGILFFSRRVFSLSRRELEFVTAVHGLRLALVTALTLIVWRLALPEVALSVWVVLLASRMLLARLPFVANKDLVFANLVLALFGAQSPTAALLAALAIATLLTHVAATVIVSAPAVLRHLVRRHRPGPGRFRVSAAPRPSPRKS